MYSKNVNKQYKISWYPKNNCMEYYKKNFQNFPPPMFRLKDGRATFYADVINWKQKHFPVDQPKGSREDKRQ